MRGDATLQARLLLRGSGAAGAVVAVGGALAVVGAYRPWYAVTAELTMLDESQSRAVAQLPGWGAHPWGWIFAALGLLAIGLGVATVIDRPPAATRRLLYGAAVTLAVGVAVGAVYKPPVNRFDIAGSRLRQLVDLAERLPAGVELEFSVAVADGCWVTLAGAAMLCLGCLAARELP